MRVSNEIGDNVARAPSLSAMRIIHTSALYAIRTSIYMIGEEHPWNYAHDFVICTFRI